MLVHRAKRSLSSLIPRRSSTLGLREPQPAPQKKTTLGDRFYGLPVEIQLQILNSLSLYDVLNLRQANRKFRRLVIENEVYLVNDYIRTALPPYMLGLYPPTEKRPKFSYLTDLAYKQRISTSLAYHLAEQIMKEMLGVADRRRRQDYDEESKMRIKERLRRGMMPLVVALFHFLETYLQRKLEQVDLKPAGDDDDFIHTLTSEKNVELQADILAQYPDDLLLSLHQMYHLLLHLFFRRMTLSSRSIVRALGFWRPHRPPNDYFAKILLIGGIDGVWQLYRIKGYRRRRRALEKYVKRLDAERKRRSVSRGKLRRVGASPSSSRAGNKSANGSSSLSASRSKGSVGSQQKAPIARLAQVQVDELVDLWTPAAEERLLSREIVEDLDEVGCCGRFISRLLSSGSGDWEDEEDEYDEADGDDPDSDDDPDSSHHNEASGYESSWDVDNAYEETTTDDDYTEYEDSALSSGGAVTVAAA